MRLYYIIPVYAIVLLSFAFCTKKAFANPLDGKVFQTDVKLSQQSGCGGTPLLKELGGSFRVEAGEGDKMSLIAVENGARHEGVFTKQDGFSTSYKSTRDKCEFEMHMFKALDKAYVTTVLRCDLPNLKINCKVGYFGHWKQDKGI